MYNHSIFAVAAIIVAWLGLSSYALAAGNAAQLHDIGTTTVDIIHALITQPIHDLTT